MSQSQMSATDLAASRADYAFVFCLLHFSVSMDSSVYKENHLWRDFQRYLGAFGACSFIFSSLQSLVQSAPVFLVFSYGDVVFVLSGLTVLSVQIKGHSDQNRIFYA